MNMKWRNEIIMKNNDENEWKWKWRKWIIDKKNNENEKMKKMKWNKR